MLTAPRTLNWLKVKQPKYSEGERGWEGGSSPDADPAGVDSSRWPPPPRPS